VNHSVDVFKHTPALHANSNHLEHLDDDLAYEWNQTDELVSGVACCANSHLPTSRLPSSEAGGRPLNSPASPRTARNWNTLFARTLPARALQQGVRTWLPAMGDAPYKTHSERPTEVLIVAIALGRIPMVQLSVASGRGLTISSHAPAFGRPGQKLGSNGDRHTGIGLREVRSESACLLWSAAPAGAAQTRPAETKAYKYDCTVVHRRHHTECAIKFVEGCRTYAQIDSRTLSLCPA
jgi:hypothetical protein